MPEEQSPGTDVPEAFSHFHDQSIKAIKAVRADLPSEEPTSGAFLIEDVRQLLQGLERDLETNAHSPTAAARAALKALGRAEAKAFVLNNLLEQLKRGESARTVLERFQQLGVVESPPPAPPDVTVRAGLVQRLERSLAKAGMGILHGLVNAIRHVPAMTKLKIKPIIGFSGVFPTVALQLDIEADSISVSELFRLLAGKQGA